MNKPIFTGEFIAFGLFDCLALEALIAAAPGPRMLEVGSWLGNGSTQVFMRGLRGRGAVYCVDTWEGNPGVKRHSDITEKFDVYETFKSNTDPDEVIPIRMDSLDAAKQFEDATFDLIFIDGDHRYEQTKADILAWLPKVKKGGILCGHDCECRPELLVSIPLDVDSIDSPISKFRHVHPGCIKAVFECVPDVRLCSDTPIKLESGEQGYPTLWWHKVL